MDLEHMDLRIVAVVQQQGQLKHDNIKFNKHNK
jgi:hypothetical protein